MCPKDVDKIANSVDPDQTGNSVDPDQTADLGLHCLPRPICPKI